MSWSLHEVLPENMNENIYANAFVVIVLLAIFAVVFLIPQAIRFGVYRFFKPRNGLFAALAGFLIPLILYGAAVVYIWFGPAIAGFGLIVNVGGGLILYGYLLAKNLRRTSLRNKS